VQAPEGWNFVDWVPEWNAGWPPDARLGYSAILNLQYVYALDRAIYMYRHLSQRDLARHWSGVRQRVAEAVVRAYWAPQRGLFADDLAGTRFSEHAQCLALLCNLLDRDDRARVIDGLLNAPRLARTTVYFSHYLFEALYHVGALEQADKRLSFWRGLPTMGLKTVLEQPEPSRSDCHAWGAHPLYHAYASYLGARPSEPGLSRLRIAPQPASFGTLRGRFPDAEDGFVSFDLSFRDGALGEIVLPGDLQGEFVWDEQVTPLQPGTNVIRSR
jgi:alpha-L-rhamnosidase